MRLYIIPFIPQVHLIILLCRNTNRGIELAAPATTHSSAKPWFHASQIRRIDPRSTDLSWLASLITAYLQRSKINVRGVPFHRLLFSAHRYTLDVYMARRVVPELPHQSGRLAHDQECHQTTHRSITSPWSRAADLGSMLHDIRCLKPHMP